MPNQTPKECGTCGKEKCSTKGNDYCNPKICHGHSPEAKCDGMCICHSAGCVGASVNNSCVCCHSPEPVTQEEYYNIGNAVRDLTERGGLNLTKSKARGILERLLTQEHRRVWEKAKEAVKDGDWPDKKWTHGYKTARNLLLSAMDGELKGERLALAEMRRKMREAVVSDLKDDYATLVNRTINSDPQHIEKRRGFTEAADTALAALDGALGEEKKMHHQLAEANRRREVRYLQAMSHFRSVRGEDAIEHYYCCEFCQTLAELIECDERPMQSDGEFFAGKMSTS